MIVSPDILRRETVQLLTAIDKQIAVVKAEAEKHGIEPFELRDATGSWPMIPLLSAKVSAVATLATLNAQDKGGPRRVGPAIAP